MALRRKMKYLPSIKGIYSAYDYIKLTLTHSTT